MRRFIAHSPFVIISTHAADGRCDASPRGDAPGFVRVIDDRTLLVPERRGNRRADSLRNIVATGRAGLLFLVPGLGETLRVNGRAAVVRDPEWLAGLSRATGLHLVMGSGWYRGAHYPAEALIDRRSVDALADVIVHDATVGVGETGIRAGIIGEIGTDKPWLSAQEERVHRAAARAARRTGLAITTHAVQSTVGLDQLDVFAAEGADLSRVVIGHADSNPSLDYHRAIVERGATVEFDFLGMAFTPLERHGEDRLVAFLREVLAGGHV
jgi:hypothetical protein